MSWFLGGAVLLFLAALVYIWRRWIAPWRSLEQMIAVMSRGERPRTFLLEGGSGPRQVALALEQLSQRQSHLDEQIAARASGADTVFAALQDGLLVVDPGHRLTFVNRSFQNLFGSREDDLGRPVLEVIRDPTLDRLIGETLERGAPQRGELTVHPSGQTPSRQLQLSAVAVKSETGLTTGAIVLFHDVTQLKQTDEIRRDFVANVSHELRTPLSILRGYIETLLEDPEISRDELTRILEVMNRHSNRLGLLVDDLLTLAQLESSRPNLQLSDVRLSELFAAIVRDWGKRFAEKRISIDVGISPGLPLLRADETRLQEVLYNLLDNALKYTEPGGHIRLQAEERGEEVALSVSDTGSGIPEADLPRIFERFYRADKARSRELGGTGLGLSIVKHIAQMHGGRVEAETILHRGTTIRVTLPIKGPAGQIVTES
jgi:two-component system phosphate regulon sensor histidine kinase PhoR